MKVVHSSLFRAVCAIIIGVLLIQYREQTVTWITIAIGVLFFLSGVISLITYFSAKRTAEKMQGQVLSDANGKQIIGTTPKIPYCRFGQPDSRHNFSLDAQCIHLMADVYHFGNSDSRCHHSNGKSGNSCQDGACGYHLLADAISSSAPGYTGYHQAFRLSLSPITHHRLGHVGIRCGGMCQYL